MQVQPSMGLKLRLSSSFFFTAAALALFLPAGHAQQLPPAEPPWPLPKTDSDTPTLHAVTDEVLVPTLVEQRDGGILYGLKPSDFILEDEGVRQKIHVQEEMDTAPVALVVAVEQGAMSALEFDKVARLAPLLDLFLAEPRSEAALVSFDSEPHLLHGYTHSSDALNEELKNLEPGDGGAAILDTVSNAVDLLNARPREYRRVLLLISEERDHGSQHAKTVEVIRKIGQSDVLVLSVSFSPSRAQLLHDMKDSGNDRTMNLYGTLLMAVQALRKNVAKEVAEESGGEYTTFTGDKRFQQRVMDAARHVRNRYVISFSPSNPAPGLHSIKVRTVNDYGARIVARSNYWVEPAQP